jgi:hypothetical protein
MSPLAFNGIVSAIICLLTAQTAYSGSIVGEVRFTNAPPQLVPIRVTKDQDYCGDTLPNEIYLVDSNGGLKNVVVFIESAPSGESWSARRRRDHQPGQ